MLISMCCNDPDNGDFAGRVCQISLPDSMLNLTAKAWGITSFRGCPELSDDDRSFKLAGKRWPFTRRRSWIGNWCWDGYVMSVADVTRFLGWLHGRNLFHCESGWVELCDAWDAPENLVLPEQWWRP